MLRLLCPPSPPTVLSLHLPLLPPPVSTFPLPLPMLRLLCPPSPPTVLSLHLLLPIFGRLNVAAAARADEPQKPLPQALPWHPLVCWLLLPSHSSSSFPSSSALNISAFLFVKKRTKNQTLLAVKRWRERSERRKGKRGMGAAGAPPEV
jgi:hypothetical protein